MFRRINILGGPGVGKSTMAARVFSDMKSSGWEIELVQEKIKEWVYDGIYPKSFDQFYIFAQQLHREDRILKSENTIIITDSPIFLTTSYAEHGKCTGSRQMIEIAREFERKYPSINVIIKRQFDYNKNARYHSEEEAREMDVYIYRHVGVQYGIVPTIITSVDGLYEIIDKEVNGRQAAG